MISLSLRVDATDPTIVKRGLIRRVLWLWELELPRLYFPVQILLILSKEGQLAS